MGTFRDTYKLLRPNGGIFVFDGFYYGIYGIELENTADIKLLRIFSALGAKVLMETNRISGGAFIFVWFRQGDPVEILPLRYTSETRPLTRFDSFALSY